MSDVVKKTVSMNVLDAAKMRIRNLYDSGCKVYLTMSGGKDSITLSSIVYDLAMRGEIDLSNTVVQFFDEEAMFDCVIDITMKWRKKFMALGAKFDWYCMEYKHFNCLNALSEDETFVCWDRRKRDVWVRQKPPFAIESHPLFKPRIDNYQSFAKRISVDGITMGGLRMAESIQRRQGMSTAMASELVGGSSFSPLYDWTDGDVFKYIRDNGVEIPEVYQFMWETGTPKNNMRISQFFSIDTAKVLSNLYEFYPDLAERVNAREPNAYLVQLYWDTEMFRRSTKKRAELEDDDRLDDEEDYRALVLDMLSDIDANFTGPNAKKVAVAYRRVLAKMSFSWTDKQWRKTYEALRAGDPKQRSLRALIMTRDREMESA